MNDELEQIMRPAGDQLRFLRVIHAAITFGLITYGGVVLFFVLQGEQADPDLAAANSGDIFKAFAVAGPIGGTVLAFVMRMFLRKTAPDASDISKVAQVKMQHVIFIALLEGAGMIGLTMGLVTYSLIGLIASILPLLILIFTFPSLPAPVDGDKRPSERH